MKIDWENLDAGEHKLTLPGEIGDIEAIIHLPEIDGSRTLIKAIAICCHPHPLYEGSMHNKVVHTVCKSFCKMGIPTLRFNFRGVGQSQGSHNNGIGESKDLLKLSKILRNSWPEQQLWLAGFSFGSWIAAKCAQTTGAKQLLSIALPITYFDLTTFQNPDCPWLVLMGEDDEIVDASCVFDWINVQANPPEIIKFPATGHFFHGQLVKMDKILQQHYRQILQNF